jgi:hypothetical protein
MKYLTHLFSVVLLKGDFSAQWNVPQVIIILKPRKLPNELSPFRPISLLTIVLKTFKNSS